MTPTTASINNNNNNNNNDSTSVHGLSDDEVALLAQKCREAKSLAYCPYSKFQVGAALLCEDGSIVVGANVENASYPVGICAERVAISKALMEGKKKFRAIAVSTNISPPASPCGMCRQFIREFCETDTPILMYDKKEEKIVMTLEQLLPMSFGPSSLPDPSSL